MVNIPCPENIQFPFMIFCCRDKYATVDQTGAFQEDLKGYSNAPQVSSLAVLYGPYIHIVNLLSVGNVLFSTCQYYKTKRNENQKDKMFHACQNQVFCPW